MKPYVICHMCTSIDGRILGNRWFRYRVNGPGVRH
jgi:riboflavin biosynthesis pyrimidine reductase